MIRTEDAALAFAVARVRRVFAWPVRCGDLGWVAQGLEALADLQDVVERHAARTETPVGLLARVADPSLLPFTPEALEAGSLRQEHREFVATLRGLRERLASVDARPAPVDEWLASPSVESYRRYHGIARDVERLLRALDAHLAAERTLGEQAPAPRRPAVSGGGRDTWA